ncbi:flagellar hook-associated protein 3 FlgL [Sphingomonas gellani]|uniref:Flagellin n=1 Tax=Sphingomonas gellani TaxID=1166340 RepID=A0A1H8CNC0_9SPHN|nr:flagellin [Sphingomonas gellani]SEM95788.1 flagellar hook-associated protein 3 FlgL [Sphingomonas gellani]
MQISTSMFYDTSSKRMTALNDRATLLQTQISTGKKIQTPSENPVLSQQSAEFDRMDSDAKVYGTNLTLADSQLSQTDSTLKQIASQVQRALELAIQAASGTQNGATRSIIGNELGSIVGALQGLANTSDVRGQPLFGTPDGTPAVSRDAQGNFSYAKTNVSEIPIGDGQTVQANESAERVFTFKGKDTLSVIAKLAAALQGGGDVGDTVKDALGDLNDANDQVSTVRASVGARAARVDLQQTLLTQSNTDRAALRSSVEDVDVTSAIAELQKTMTVLSATQASFTKLSSLSLFDYLK